MKILIEVEPENPFEAKNLKINIKNYIKLQLPLKFKLKKVSVEVLG